MLSFSLLYSILKIPGRKREGNMLIRVSGERQRWFPKAHDRPVHRRVMLTTVKPTASLSKTSARQVHVPEREPLPMSQFHTSH